MINEFTNRTTYQIDITAREKEAIERISQGVAVVGDMPLMDDVLRKIAALPKKDLDTPPASDQ